MVDRLTKTLHKLTAKERRGIKKVIELIKTGQIWGLDIKKLQGAESIYRVCEGRWRIICWLKTDGTIKILDLERRSDTTYNKY